MAAPTLNSITPQSGPPQTVVTLQGAGFDAGAQVACPTLVDTTYVSDTELLATIPEDLVGPARKSVEVLVSVTNEDGSQSVGLPFTVMFPADRQQTWTTLGAVCGEVPGFKRGGDITDATILGWMRSIAQTINGTLLRRGLPLNPDGWQQADSGTASPAPAAVLELINRYGAAARLAAVVGARFSADGKWALTKALQDDYDRERKALETGQYDKLFRPAAATVESAPLLSAADLTNDDGSDSAAFTKGQVF